MLCNEHYLNRSKYIDITCDEELNSSVKTADKSVAIQSSVNKITPSKKTLIKISLLKRTLTKKTS